MPKVRAGTWAVRCGRILSPYLPPSWRSRAGCDTMPRAWDAAEQQFAREMHLPACHFPALPAGK